MHKVVKLKVLGNGHYPYEGTKATLEMSVGEIKTLLGKHGCTRIAEMTDQRGKDPLVTLAWEHSGIPFMVEFPVTYSPQGKLRMEISGRIIFHRIKAMLIEVEIDLWSFTQAMSPFLALPGADGRLEPMYDYVEEHRAELTARVLIFPQLTTGERK